MTAPTVTPEVGQVWADNDRRAAGRTVLVDQVGTGRLNGYVHIRTLTDSDDTRLAIGWGHGKTSVGRQSWAKAVRLRPTSTGYRLLGAIETEHSDGTYTGAVVRATTALPEDREPRFGGPFPVHADAARWLLDQEASR